MRKNYPRYTLRIPKEMHEKLEYISNYNGRTKNKEIELILQKSIDKYERENGEIEISTCEDEY